MVWIGLDRSRPTWKSKWDAKRDTRISFLPFVLLKRHLWRALAFSLVKKSLLQASKKLFPSLLENFSHSPLHSDFSILHSSDCSAVMMRSLDHCIWPRVWWALQESQTPAPWWLVIEVGFSLIAKSRTLGWLPLLRTLIMQRVQWKNFCIGSQEVWVSS